MASNRFVAFAIVAVVLPTFAMATEYFVGDDEGWKVGVNYSEWANGKVFRVGDKLVFKYGSPHNVYKVDGNGFKECKPSGDVYNNGNDTFILSEQGKKWYICGVNDHCEKGQKLVINVEFDGSEPVPAPVPAPTPPKPAPVPASTPPPTQTPPSNDSYRIISSCYQIFVAAVVAMAVAAF